MHYTLGAILAIGAIQTALAASWIGEAGETELTWRTDDAKRARGITGAKGHDWIISNRLSKATCYLRKTFTLANKPIARVRSTTSGMGFYELWINQRKVDPQRVMAPGQMPLSQGVLADVRDVTTFLRPGQANTIGIWLASGYGDDFSRFGWVWLAPKRAWLSLRVEYADGETATIETDGSWQSCTDTAIPFASIYHGETYDAGKAIAAFGGPRTADGSTLAWRPVSVFPDGPNLVTSSLPPIDRCETFKPIAIVESESNVYTVDFGQNLAGVIRLRAKGKRGTTITMKTAELLNDRGRIDQRTYNAAKSLDTFILAGTGTTEEYTPRFTYHGFRYAEVRGYPGKLTADDLESVAVHADVAPTSSFVCSDDSLNWLHRAAKWSMLSNLMSYPTDCCMRRERTPCMMDSECYEDVSCQMFDMSDYYETWLNDTSNALQGAGSPDWSGDAAILPLRLWRYYGNRARLEARLPGIRQYLDNLLTNTPSLIVPGKYGDWCAPNSGTWASYFNDVSEVNTALFAHFIDLYAQAARDLGRTADADRFAAVFEKVKAAYTAKFYHPDTAEYGDGSQTTAVLPLAFGLVPEGERARVIARLLARINGKDGGKIDTGIFGTRYIGEVLCDIGACDTLVNMYTQTNYPGFGNMKAQGATTLWEQWTSRGGMNSHNHAMNAGGACWLYTRLAGIRPVKPGYAEILVKPCFPKALSFVEATRQTPVGTIRVAWRRQAGKIVVKVTVPSNCPATLDLPNGQHALHAGENTAVLQ